MVRVDLNMSQSKVLPRPTIGRQTRSESWKAHRLRLLPYQSGYPQIRSAYDEKHAVRPELRNGPSFRKQTTLICRTAESSCPQVRACSLLENRGSSQTDGRYQLRATFCKNRYRLRAPADPVWEGPFHERPRLLHLRRWVQDPLVFGRFNHQRESALSSVCRAAPQ